MTYLLTLVHGTWPDPDGWVSARSFLRRELASHLGDVVFRDFTWAGANTHSARAEAGASLARFLRAGREEHPAARHVVIAHSHGGNVALYAMRDPAARRAVDGIVTLATPFLFATPRDLRSRADVIAWVVLGVVALLSLAAIDLLIDLLGIRQLFLAWLAGASVLMLKGSPVLAGWLIAAGTRKQADIVPAYQAPRIDRSRLFIISTRADEASGWLRAWEIVAKGPFLIGCLLLAVVEVALRSNVVATLDEFAQSIFRRGLHDLQVFGLDGTALAVAGIATCITCGLALPLVSSVVRWPGYWREPILANVLVDIGSRSVPVASSRWAHTAHSVEIPREPLWKRLLSNRLRHSAICGHPAVVSAIGDWIRHGSRPDGDRA